MLEHRERFVGEAGQKLRRTDVGGQQTRMVSANSVNRVSRRFSFSGVSGGGSPTAAACRSTGNSLVSRSGSRPDRCAPASRPEGGQQRAVVLDGLGHLVVEAFVVLPLDTVGAELDSFG